MRLAVTSVLVLLYSLFVLVELYVSIMGGPTITKSIFILLGVFAILALIGRGGSSFRFWAYLLCGLLGLLGVGLTGYSVWAHVRDVSASLAVLWIGPVLLVVSVATYWVVSTRRESIGNRSAEGGSQ